MTRARIGARRSPRADSGKIHPASGTPKPTAASPENAVLVRRSVRIVNPRGLHARPCHALVSAALEFESTLRVSCDGKQADGKSILSLMTLSAPVGSELELVAEGDDAQALVERLAGLVDAGFSESD